MAQGKFHHTCLTYCSLPYNGQGWPQTCVSILDGFSTTSLRPILAVPRARGSLPEPIALSRSLPFPLSVFPWKYASRLGMAALDSHFRKLLNRADPETTMAYFWPGVPASLVEHARSRGILTVREMINTFQATAKDILDRAYEKAGLPIRHTITQKHIDEEQEELGLYDYICAPSPLVETSLRQANIGQEKIIPTSFGWSPRRFEAYGRRGHSEKPAADRLKVLFVGSISVRKGIPELLEAWSSSGVQGELILVGHVEPALEPLVSKAVETGSVKIGPFTSNVGEYYRACDMFVFPTLEEGAPQVIFEAGGCGMPIITTAMGAARLIKNNVSGLIVPEGNVSELSTAIATLAADRQLRQKLSQQVSRDAQEFTYDKLGATRAAEFVRRLARA